MNDLAHYENIFEGIKPWSGRVPAGYLVDFLGTLTDARFHAMYGVDPTRAGGEILTTRLPTIADGEGWFEAVNWVSTAREARRSYTMITLGSCYGAQAVGSYRALQQLNPMPAKLCRGRAGAGQLPVDRESHARQRHRPGRAVALALCHQR